MPKISISLSNTFENLNKNNQNSSLKNKKKRLKPNLTSLKFEEKIDITNEIKQAKEIKDLEKIIQYR